MAIIVEKNYQFKNVTNIISLGFVSLNKKKNIENLFGYYIV